MTKYIKYLVPTLSLLLFLSCSTDPVKEIKTEPVVPKEPKVTDFYHFKHLLPESDYAYDIAITNIKLKSHKGAFSITKEKYDKPEKIDGLTISIAFDITNPYSKAMKVPFPEYFEITAKEFEGLDDFIYSKGCRCYINNETTIENSKGNPLSSFSKYSQDAISRQLLVDFEAKETKHIVIHFTKPFPSYIKTVTLIGFNKYLQKQIDFYKLSEDEKQKYLADKSKQYGLVIDINSKKLKDLIAY